MDIYAGKKLDLDSFILCSPPLARPTRGACPALCPALCCHWWLVQMETVEELHHRGGREIGGDGSVQSSYDGHTDEQTSRQAGKQASR